MSKTMRLPKAEASQRTHAIPDDVAVRCALFSQTQIVSTFSSRILMNTSLNRPCWNMKPWTSLFDKWSFFNDKTHLRQHSLSPRSVLYRNIRWRICISSHLPRVASLGYFETVKLQAYRTAGNFLSSHSQWGTKEIVARKIQELPKIFAQFVNYLRALEYDWLFVVYCKRPIIPFCGIGTAAYEEAQDCHIVPTAREKQLYLAGKKANNAKFGEKDSFKALCECKKVCSTLAEWTMYISCLSLYHLLLFLLSLLFMSIVNKTRLPQTGIMTLFLETVPMNTLSEYLIAFY